MNETTTTVERRELTFVRGLYELAEDRGAMAKLRRSLRAENPMADPDAASVIAMLLYGVPDWDEGRYYLIAGLFALAQTGAGGGVGPALHNNPWEGENLGASFRQMRDREARQRGLSPDDRTSLDGRFVALLNSDPEDLPVRLRHSVRLLASRDIPVDWARLLWDLKHFRDAGRKVQEDWARAYWKRSRRESEETETIQTKEA